MGLRTFGLRCMGYTKSTSGYFSARVFIALQICKKPSPKFSRLCPVMRTSLWLEIGDWKNEVYCTIHLTKKPKSEKIIFNKITKVLNKFIQKEYGRYNISFLDFSYVETQRENQQKQEEEERRLLRVKMIPVLKKVSPDQKTFQTATMC